MKRDSALQRALIEVPMLIGGEWRKADEMHDVVDPYRNEIVARASRSSLADLDAALQSAVAAKPVMAAMPGYERAALLRRVKALLLERADEVADTVTPACLGFVRLSRVVILRGGRFDAQRENPGPVDRRGVRTPIAFRTRQRSR